MQPTDPTDEELARRHHAGDPTALGKLMKRHWARLAGFLQSKFVPPSDLDDLIQDVWLRVLRHASKWDGNMAWVMTIARNVFLDSQKKKRLKSLDEDLIELEDIKHGSMTPEVDPDLPHCLEDLSHKNERAYKLVVAFYYAETDDDSLASDLGIKPVSIRTGRSKALTFLRECIEKKRQS